MIPNRSDQVWEFRDSRGRHAIAWMHAPVSSMHHAVTVFFSTDERLWELGVQRWAEGYDEPYEGDAQFTRLL